MCPLNWSYFFNIDQHIDFFYSRLKDDAPDFMAFSKSDDGEADFTTKPVTEDTRKSMVTKGTKPITDGTKSATEGKTPPTEEMKPKTDGTKTETEGTKPVTERTTSVTEGTKPMTEDMNPVDEKTTESTRFRTVEGVSETVTTLETGPTTSIFKEIKLEDLENVNTGSFTTEGDYHSVFFQHKFL